MSIRSAAVWAMSSYYTAFVVQFATSVVLARWFITPADLGTFTIAFAAVTLVSFLQDFGVNRYITGAKHLDGDQIRAASTVSLAFGLGIALLALALAWPVARFYGDPAMLPVLVVIAGATFLTPFSTVPQALRQREMDFRANAMIELGSAICNAGVSLLLAARGWGALALACGYLGHQGSRAAIAQLLAGGVAPLPLRWKGTRPILELGATNCVLSICASITAKTPELLIGRVIGNAGTGLFARAGGLTQQLRIFVTGAVGTVFFPAFRQVRDRGDPLGPPYIRVVSFFTAVIWPAMAGIALLAEPVVRLLYGEAWIGAAPLLSCLAVAQMLYSAIPANSDLPILLGAKRSLIHRNVWQTVAAVALIAVALPFGLFWVAASRIAAGLAFVLLFAGFTRSLAEFSWRELLGTYAKSALATLAAIAPTVLIYLFAVGPDRLGFIGMLVAASAGVGCWFVTLRLLGHQAFGEIAGLAQPLLLAARRRLPPRPALEGPDA